MDTNKTCIATFTTPTTFTITDANDSECTTSIDSVYTIGCSASGNNPTLCKSQFEGLNYNSSGIASTSINVMVG